MKKFFTKEWWTIMKIGVTQLFLALSFCGVTLAHNNYAQVLEQKVSIHVTDAPLEDVLHEIANAANVFFSYSPDLISTKNRVTYHAENKSIRQILNELLTSRRIAFSVDKDGWTIFLKPLDDPNYESKSFIDTQSRNDTWQQITGTLRDSQNQPLAGVNVVVKGTVNGTTSDINGEYTISAETGDILVFSFIGFASQEVTVGQQTQIDVILQEEVKNLDEVTVNVGYWEVKQKEQTGNVVRVTSEEIQRQPINNPLQSLQGRMVGVYVEQSSGVPGSAFRIRIRGQNSLRTDGNEPMYIIDGVPFTSTSLTATSVSGSILQEGNPLSSVNPSDIQSIEILKDADATAIYGSRGANGVVLITTRKGAAGRTKVNLNLSHGLGRVSNYIKLLKTSEYLTMRRQAFINDGAGWPPDPSWHPGFPDLFAWDTTRYTNWQKELIGKTAHTTNAQLSVSGGNERTQFSITGGYYKESTVFPGDYSFQRISGGLNMNHLSQDKKFRLAASVNHTTNLNNLLPTDLTSTAVTLAPNSPALYLENGDINWDWKSAFIINPLSNTKRNYKNTTANWITSLTSSYEMVKGVNAKVNLGYTAMNVDELVTNPLGAIPPQYLSGQTGSSTFGKATMQTWIAEPQITWDKVIGDGALSFLVGSTFQETTRDNDVMIANGYTSDALLENKRAATSWNIVSADYYKYRYAAVFVRANYNWREKYIVNLTARRDGSSRFGKGNQFGNFGAAGVAWIFSRENFLADQQVLSFGKVRSSLGLTGSDAIGNYQYLSTYSPTTYPYSATPGLQVTRLSNADYSWETNKKFEIALDLGFVNDRIQFNTGYYDNRSSNQLVGMPLPAVTGQTSVQFNLPATVQNRGWELQLYGEIIKRSNISWTTSVNVTLPSNKLLAFPNLEAYPAYANQYMIGKSVYTKKTFTSTGVDPQTGIYTFKDLNNDDYISSTDDTEFTKQVSQTFFGGINNSIAFKGVQLDFLFQFVKQTGYNYFSYYSNPGGASNQPSLVASRWQKPGDTSTIQQASLFGPGTMAYFEYMFSDRAISDASFVRLKNISLSYALPVKWMKINFMQDCRIYANAQNLFTITNYLGMDPENQNVNYLPPLRMFSFGINVTL